MRTSYTNDCETIYAKKGKLIRGEMFYIDIPKSCWGIELTKDKIVYLEDTWMITSSNGKGITMYDLINGMTAMMEAKRSEDSGTLVGFFRDFNNFTPIFE